MKEVMPVPRTTESVLVLVAAFTILLPLSYGHAHGSGSVIVEIVPGATYLADKAYSPSPVTVKVGDTVTWINKDSGPHTVTSGDSWFDRNAARVFDSKFIFPKNEFSYTFKEPGIYNYFSNIQGQYSMVGQVIVEEAPPRLALTTQKQSYAAGQTVVLRGETSIVQSVPVEIQVFNPQGRAYLFDSATVANNGSFTYSFIASDTQGTGSYRVVATYLGSTAEATFRLDKSAGTGTAQSSAISVAATSKGAGSPVTITLKNTVASGIYRFALTLPDEPTSVQAPRGWSADTDGTTVVFYTDDRPVESGKRVAFRVAAGPAVSSFDWTAFAGNGSELDSGTASVRVRR